MNPSTAIAGAAGLVLNLTGTNFVSQSTVFVNNCQSQHHVLQFHGAAGEPAIHRSAHSRPGINPG